MLGIEFKCENDVFFEIHSRATDQEKYTILRKKIHFKSAGVPAKSEIPNVI